MHEQVERRIVTCERISWRQPELNKFALKVFGLFTAQVMARPSWEQKLLSQELASQMRDFSPESDSRAQIFFRTEGVTFYFCDYLPRGVYRDELGRLFNFNGQKVSQPIQSNIFFYVGVEHSSEDTNQRNFERVLNFFRKIQAEGQPIGLPIPTAPIIGKYFSRAVYANIKPDEFKKGIEKTPVQSFPPSKDWALELMREFMTTWERR